MQSHVKPTPQHHTTEPEPHQPSIHSLTRVNKFRTQQFDDLSLNPSNEQEPSELPKPNQGKREAVRVVGETFSQFWRPVSSLIDWAL